MRTVPIRCLCWWRDPLSHPDIARMSERERADLPFDPGALTPDPGPASEKDQARP